MRKRLFAVVSTLVPILLIQEAGLCQSSPSLDKDAFARHARSLYYRPLEDGLVSFTCRVKFDWDTVPKAILVPAQIAGHGPLDKTRLLVTVNYPGGVSSRHELTQDAPGQMRPVYDKFFDVLSNLASGFLQTWASKALQSPIPEGRFLTSVERSDTGYLVKATSAPAHFTYLLSGDYRMNQMVTQAPDGDIEEHTVYSDSPQGFVITGNDGTSKNSQQTTHMRYEMSYQMVEGFRLPSAVHLSVNDNIDTKFSFEDCTVQKGIVLKVSPPSR